MTTAVTLAPTPVFKAFDNNGFPLFNGQLFTYVAGSSTPQVTYVDSTGTTTNTNPIILNARGEANVWLATGLTYKLVLQDLFGNQIWSVDNVPGGLVLTAQFIGQILYPTLSIEGGTVVNPQYNYGTIDRYGTNTSPGTTDMLLAINNAITAANAGIGTVTGLGTTYFHSAALTMKANVILRGQGKFATTFSSSHTGNGIVTTSTLNTTTGVFTEIRDCRFKNTNASNTGGGLIDIAGTEVSWHSVRVEGFKYSAIFDQTELGDADLCDFTNFLTGGVWLTNGADHTFGANAGFTNRISVNRSQINGGAGGGGTAQGIGIIDDGGVAHEFHDNNFNLCVNHFRLAAGLTVNIDGSEFETASGPCFIFTTTTSVLGTAVGGCGCVVINNNYISPSAASSFQAATVATGALAGLCLTNNRFITSSATIINTSNINTVFAYGNEDSNAGIIFDGLAGHHFETAVAKGTTTIVDTNIQLTGAVNVTGAIKTSGLATFNGATPVAQTTGWGTPVGGTVIASYNITDAGGANSNTNKALAEVLVVLKNVGLIGA